MFWSFIQTLNCNNRHVSSNVALIDTSSDNMNLNYCLIKKISVLERWCYRSWWLTGFLHTKGLTWTFLDAKCAVGVLGSGVVLQLKRCGVVHKRLRALGHARPAVVEIGARLRRKEHDPGQPWMASRPPDAGGGVIFSQHLPQGNFIPVTFWVAQLSLSSQEHQIGEKLDQWFSAMR